MKQLCKRKKIFDNLDDANAEIERLSEYYQNAMARKREDKKTIKAIV